ncbi:cupin domain-containing protein [Thermodesulfobacteriota bacterium]
MKKLSYFAVSMLALTVLFAFSMNTVMAADMMPGSSDVKVLLDNDEVKVSEATRSPGTIVPMHTHPKFFAYYIDAAQVKLTSPAGKETVKDIPAGKFLWFPEGTSHALEVMGTANQHVFVVEWK